MTTSATTPPTELPAAEFHPGHSLILEPPEGPSALACTCGGLLDPTLDAEHSQLARFHAHLKEASREETLA
ncbi:hypothetical protein ACH419_36630 [Streptomyces bobili]|uniref:hypothetical protein n=1 Tax=Streptomyces bobili TaxID=67280 RepID=UPI003797DFD6